MRGTFDGVPVRVLKDDGCNTNVISREFYESHRDLFNASDSSVTVSHSRRGATEFCDKVILGATLQLGPHRYRSNFAVASARYDVLLGMPWHVDVDPKVDYQTPSVDVAENCIPLSNERNTRVEITNMGVKKFRSMLRKKGGRDDFEVFALVEMLAKPSSNHAKKKEHEGLKELLRSHSDVFREDLPSGLPPQRSVDHAIEIEKDAKPPMRPLYQLSPAELLAVKEYVTELLKKGKIRRSKSPFGASLFFAKHNGKIRAVVDYRALNRITKRNNAPLPRSDEMFDRLGEARVFSKLDLKTGFHQIRVRPEDVEKTAFNTKYGQFEYLVMPMGLCNAPATFQSLMNEIFSDCIDDFMVVYIDDLLIFSKNPEDHLDHLRIVLSRLKAHKLYVTPSKCSFMLNETEFLGMIVGAEGIRVNPEKVRVLQEWPRPETLTELRGFIGLLQFFRRFIRGFSAIASPLTNLTKKGIGIQRWDERCDRAFTQLKESMISAPILVSPVWSKPFRCHVDASQKAVGGTLTQLDDNGAERVVAFFSRKLSDAEQRYTANERELLSLVYFLKRFRCYLEGSHFEVFTDNQVLKHFFTKPLLNRREARWLEFLSQFGISSISLKAGRVHVLGDVLSRAPHVMSDKHLNMNNVSVMTRHVGFDKGYEEDQFFGPIIRALRGEWPDDEVQKQKCKRIMHLFRQDGALLFYKDKICVPRKHVRTVLFEAHDVSVSGHFGVGKTLARLEQYHWKGKGRDTEKYCKGCVTCQQQKNYHSQRKFTDPSPLDVPERRWGSLGTDFIVKLPKSKKGFDSITTWVDRLSRRVHFIPCHENDTAVQVANDFFANIFKLHGLPDSIVSDRDPKFTSKFWSHLLSLCGIKSQMSSSHHPQTDGASEVMNRMLENYLRCFCNLQQDNWDELLPSAEFAYNSAETADLGTSPFEVDLGWKPRGPLDMINRETTPVEKVNEFRLKLKVALEDAQFAHNLAKARNSAYTSMKYQPHRYSIGDKVWLDRELFRDGIAKSQTSQKLSARRFGPFTITELVGRNAIRLDLPTNIRLHPVVHTVHTTPFFEQPTDISQPVPQRPIPTPDADGHLLFKVQTILRHRKRGRGYQFLTLLEGVPRHEAVWQPTRDFVDSDGTMTEAFYEYIKAHNILQHLWENE